MIMPEGCGARGPEAEESFAKLPATFHCTFHVDGSGIL